MKNIYYFTTFFAFTILFFVVHLFIWVLVLPFDRDRIVSQKYSRYWAKMIYKISPRWKIKVEGLENMDKNKSYIIIANHQSMWDIPLLYQLPNNFKWVSKEEVFRIPFFGWMLWMHDDIAIKRGGAAGAKKMMDKCDRMLKRGISVIIFPEGSRTKDGRVADFKKGSFLLAKKSKVEILPVVINGNFDAFITNKKGKKKIVTPHSFNVKVLRPVTVDQIKDLRFDAVSDMLQQIITDEHRKMAPQYYDQSTTQTTQQ